MQRSWPRRWLRRRRGWTHSAWRSRSSSSGDADMLGLGRGCSRAERGLQPWRGAARLDNGGSWLLPHGIVAGNSLAARGVVSAGSGAGRCLARWQLGAGFPPGWDQNQGLACGAERSTTPFCPRQHHKVGCNPFLPFRVCSPCSSSLSAQLHSLQVTSICVCTDGVMSGQWAGGGQVQRTASCSTV